MSNKAVYYVVLKGRCPGIYETWTACRDQVDGFSGAIFKRFKSLENAQLSYESKTLDVPELCGTSKPNLKKQRFQKCNGLRAATARGGISSSRVKQPSAAEEEKTEHDRGDNNVDDDEKRGEEIPKEKRKRIRTSHLNWESIFITAEVAGQEPERLWKQNSPLVVYTDGSSKENGYENCYAGCGVWFGEEHALNRAFPLPNSNPNSDRYYRPTNIRAEYYAVYWVLRNVDVSVPLTILTDCMEVVEAMNSKDEDIRPDKCHIELVTLMRQRSAMFQSVAIEKVKAHVGILGNEMADRFAHYGACHGVEATRYLAAKNAARPKIKASL